MKSPFPGMDPYIEACGLWEDFHHHLVEKIYDSLAAVVPDHYIVRAGERSYLELMEPEGKKRHSFVPDVRVSGAARPRKTTRGGGTALAEPTVEAKPVELRAFIAQEHREAFVEILEAEADHRLVTTIEVLSPSNKRPGTQSWDLYQRKRQSVLLGGVHLVEIDLLRGGQKPPMIDPWPTSPYTLLVARALRDYHCRVWPAHWRRPLPSIPVPLVKPDPDIPLDLQPLIEAIYERSRYERSIDYARPLTPPLTAEETAWLKQQLRADSSRKPQGGRRRPSG